MQPHRLVSIPDDLINEVQFEIPEAPYDSIVLFMRRALCDFCEISHYWQEEIGPLMPQLGAYAYDIDAPRGSSIVSVLKVSTADNELHRSQDEGVRYRFWQSSSGAIEISPIDELAGKSISIIAALQPEVDGNNFKFSETILRDYRDAIAAGTKAKLYMIPRKPWTDLNLAQANAVKFQDQAGEALRARGRGFSKLPDRSIPKKREFY